MNKKNKISKSDLSEIIMETIYEMIQAGDEALIKLMMEAEAMHGEVDDNINEWVEKTTAVLQEHLDIEPDAPEVICEERDRMLHLANVITEAADKVSARELELYIDNDGDLYKQQYLPILKNLSLKAKKGKYDKKLAIKLWMHMAETGAKKYHREFGGMEKWSDMFNKATRLVTATEFETSNREAVMDGDYL